MISGIYIGGNLLSWILIGALLLLYRLDKIYPRIIEDLAKREAAPTVPDASAGSHAV